MNKHLLLCLFCCMVGMTNGQFNVELRFKSPPPNCSTLPCVLTFCMDTHCTNAHQVEFKAVGDLTSIPLNEQPFNISFHLAINKQGAEKEIIAEWSGRLTKNWHSMSNEFAEARLKCSDNFYGPLCLIHCVPLNSNQECDQETGQRRCIEGYRGMDCMEPVNCSLRCVHGKCSQSGECVCLPGYEGRDCRIRASTCNALKPCMNGGSCHNLKHGTYECKCLAGFNGPQCERRMITCAHDNPCQNGAECQQDFGRPLQCKCPPDYHGQFCQVWAKNCSSLPCQNRAQCVKINDDFGCVCLPGYVGRICDQKQQRCTPTTCLNHGVCIENSANFGGIECVCKAGYLGTYCDVATSDCRTSPCLNNGICKANSSTYQCHCPRGYTGNLCEVFVKTVELDANSSVFLWIIFLLVAMLFFALVIIGCLGLIHLRHRRISSCLNNLVTTIGSQHQQPPRIKPPPTPLLHSQHFSSGQFLLKKKEDTEKGAMEMKRPHMLSADALCRPENLYTEEPSRCFDDNVDTPGYSNAGGSEYSVETSFESPETCKRATEQTTIEDGYAEIFDK